MEEELKRKIEKIENELNSLNKRNEIESKILDAEKLKSQLLKEDNKQLRNDLLEQYEINNYYRNELNKED